MEPQTNRGTTPLIAAAAAAAGLVGGALIGAHRRPSKTRRVADGFASTARALAEMSAEQNTKQSPVEVVLSALTSRRIPRHG